MAIKKKKIIGGIIDPEGEGNTKAKVKVITVPLDLKNFEDWIVESKYTPNDNEDIPIILNNIKKGKIWVGCDVYGEGVVGFGNSSAKLKNALRTEFLEKNSYKINF